MSFVARVLVFGLYKIKVKEGQHKRSVEFAMDEVALVEVLL